MLRPVTNDPTFSRGAVMHTEKPVEKCETKGGGEKEANETGEGWGRGGGAEQKGGGGNGEKQTEDMWGHERASR